MSPAHSELPTNRAKFNPLSGAHAHPDAHRAATLSPDSPGTGWRTRIDGGLLVILSLPWLILRFDTTWLFAYAGSSQGFIDPWVYFGYFLDLKQHLRSFKGAYFTTRLSWTIPGAIVYRIFPAQIAPYLLHVALFYAATISFYLILKHTVSQRAAMLGTVLMGCHSYFLRSMGWDYIDGAAITYYLMTLGALTFAAKSDAASRKWLFAAGALAALTVYCQLFLIVFSPLALGYYLFARRKFECTPLPGARRLFGYGFVLVTIILGVFNMTVNGRFFFFVNSMGEAAKLVINHNPYNDVSFHWLAGATWLALPAVALIAAILCLRSKHTISALPKTEFVLFWQRYLVLSAAIMVVWELLRQPVLQLSFYASYLIPVSFLALGSLAEPRLRTLGRWQFVMLISIVLCVSLLPFVLPGESALMLSLQSRALLWPVLISLTGVTVIARARNRVSLAGLFLLILGLTTLTAANSTRTWGQAGQADDPAFQKYAFLAIVDSVRTTQELDPKANLFFWYDYGDRLGKLFRSVASTYGWSYRLQSESFPNLGAKIPPLGRRIVILSSNGEIAAAKAATILQDHGLNARLITKKTIREGPFTWEMTEIEIVSAAAGSSPQSRIQKESWTAWTGKP